MISNSIQELFDGTLSDEQTAELLHSLSVSPERLADFRRHMALQGLMQRDRAASELDSDEDRAIWGVLAGLGAATTVGGAAANYAGGFAKVLGVVAIGIGGYLLGSFTNFFGMGRSTAVNPPAAVAPASQVTEARPTVPARPGSAPASSSIPYTSLPGTQGASGTVSGAAFSVATAVPKVIYKDRIVYRDRPAAASAATTTARTDNGGSNNRRSTSSTATMAAQTPDAAAKSTALGNDSSTSPSGASGGTQNAQGSMSPSVTEPAKAQPTDSGAQASSTTNSGAPVRRIDPADALRRPDDPLMPDEQKPSISALWSNGFELSYGEYVGMLSGDLIADDVGGHDPYYSSRHLDITYRAFNGRFGLGARVGYGTFSRVSLYMERDIRYNLAREIIRADSMYRARVQPEKQTLTEFFMNYRIPVMNNLGMGLEASWGRSPVHMKAGGSVIVHWLMTEHLGLQAGGGLSKYWYSYVGGQREQILRDGGDGTSISDKVSDSYTGTSFEARYGIFYHF